MYKLIGSILAVYFSINVASAQVSSKASISVTIVSPVGVELGEATPDNPQKRGLRIIGDDQSYSITLWNGEKYIDLQKCPGKEELLGMQTISITVNFE